MPPERMSGPPSAPFGAWPSPISTADVVRCGLRPGYPTAVAGAIWWEEDRPTEGGRRTIVHQAADGVRRELLPAPWDARTRVHEYGGRSYAVAPGVGVVFASHGDQRLHLVPATPEVGGAQQGGPPVAITPEPETPCGLRYAEPAVHDDEVWCVQERHAGEGKVTRSIVSVPLRGGEPRRRVSGSDFYAFPAISPDGGHVAYICWDHPSMPWTGTFLRVTRLADGASWTVMGGPAESVLAPRWKDRSTLYAISDRSGWWNLYEIGAHGEAEPRALYPAEEEFAWAPGELGGAPYAVLPDGRLAVLHGRPDLRLGVLDPRTGTLTDLDLPYDGWVPCLSVDGATVCGVAYGPGIPRSVVRVDTATGRAESLRSDIGELPHPDYLPEPRRVEIRGRSGRRVHARVHPPANPSVRAGDAPPPYVVDVHGGPAWHTTSALDLRKAFLTSRGIGIIEVDHGGSTGYGRAYRERLKGHWGIVDVEDVIAAAEWLLSDGHADPARIAIRGAGAGAWTALTACCSSGLFCGAVAVAAISTLAPLAATTHDFESRYVEWLVGPPDPLLYASREPLARCGQVDRPMLLMQGQEDPIVPPAQPEAFAAALNERGVPCVYLAFEGEGHEFRRAETKSAALAAELSFYQQIFRG
ncbi:acyl-peptide hydrolase [Sphaerisporangium melleum]|uniref:Acyl-peptide hydrolase n=1 Tax=Sphaerisporangium melleum TaxID=321316 RepID=A0A917R1K5_9ACTN|nr:prolyl oligopeptidase family serine peptidase [Sphaerisporangium melleum]GGK82987.1 acyl-peptide hydrolase [Sphaerisporangium melleum]GII69224.1 acyl-peptide hydrolase [Sphaerisporangium melleum]